MLVACLLDAQAPHWFPNLRNRLKYYVIQLGDPNPNQNNINRTIKSIQTVINRRSNLQAGKGVTVFFFSGVTSTPLEGAVWYP